MLGFVPQPNPAISLFPWVPDLYFYVLENNQIRLPEAATFKLPSRKRGWGCVAENLHTPLSPLSKGESQKIEIPEH